MSETVALPGSLQGYLSVPDGAGPWPGVVVLHEAFGLTDDIRAITDRFASEGYVALAPDLYSWDPPQLSPASFTASLFWPGCPNSSVMSVA